MLINAKMPTIVGILTFMSRINLCLAELSMEKVLLPQGQLSLLERIHSKTPESTTPEYWDTSLIKLY